MDKITKILQQMHEMADEPVGMQEGGVAGTLTPEQYQQRFIDYYAFPGIGVEAAPPADTEEEQDEPVRPDILVPVGQRDESAPNIFRQVPIGRGQAYDVDDLDPKDYIENFGKDRTTYTSDAGGFKEYLTRGARAIKERNMEVPGVVTMATGLPIGAMAFGAAELNRKQQLKNATDIAATGGRAGSMFTLNGQTVSRAPGSTRFDGTILGMSNEQLYRLDEIRRGFVPGTMKETLSGRPDEVGVYNRTGKDALSSAGDVMIDAFGTVHGAGGPQMVGALQAERAREKMFKDAMSQAGVSLAGVNVSNAALAMKQGLDAHMRGSKSFFTTTARMSDSDYAKALTRSQEFIANYIAQNHAQPEPETPTAPDEVIVPDAPIQAQTSPSSSDDGDDSVRDAREYSISQGFSVGSSGNAGREFGGGQSFGVGSSIGGGFAGARAMGGRVGMQAGGTAQRPLPEAGFVAGPPENFTERETVADDQNGSVAEGTFVINAAAVEFAGSDDIRKMILDAYSTAREKGLDIGRVDRKLYEGTVDVALSKGEVIVPPELAKIIGYDRLEKINNRGKKEVSRRQEAAGGGFLDGKKFAKGGEAPKTLPKRKPRKGQLADVELRADLEEFIKDDQLARLGWDLYTSGDLKLVGLPVQRGVRAYSAAGIYLPAEGRDTFPVFPSGLGYSAEQESQREKVGGPASLQDTFVEPLFKGVGKVLDPKAPTAMYFAEPFKIHPEDRTTDAPTNDRAQVMITLAHELRHAAMNHLVFDYGAPQMTLSGEEALMDHFDEKARRTASKKNALVSAIPLTKGRKQRYEAARYSSYNKEKYELYNKLATEVLKERGVPTIAPPEEKGFIKKFLDNMFRKSPPSKLKKGDGKPVDYESEAMQSANF